ncbi:MULTISPECIES: tRNA (cytidine(34)-2'-O)-methyltransferase [Acinetobacter]|uniref:tRNA (cytidine(34)-2'-O)-methyltransferase n=1 Tax=Acinetobacter baylyi (strain ATCC 33305 / BD413 / ADP1) TaxID=62977 RepID=Q6F8G7_ACIAD|nr:MULTISPECIES: tRNA (cytidine(34)-2'-O)-methyltransferase [Acinetobacter]ENV53195.1 tRNA (cytidine(34)-2'-O)-methyltransferase [Acinetobacter baylyi DSM 14961 = CIP 107474]KAF2372166.1 tRNA (uridine(34)/cytosine(34)/5-carboxymethylaminomethyluridine(34)-2'-O)-methyltransferase TrmL [Acinetobacter baylyi]KAF2372490.1 tRNA (uridine(34)/cytosine(34)/5-carboxymethylaminomethyluridine(34)-2'-O)-methyltransferase TrmL [Acinetobacter baylyi]KAF2376918.1 tRNA (uridine(34)/cytosine(34)/5-carboxymethyl
MIHVVLFEPEIPANTGNIIRLCANTGAQLHLVKPLGFELDDKKLKRAGLDYHEYARMKIWDNIEQCLESLKSQGISESDIFPLTTKGSATPHTVDLNRPVALLMGPETRGLPESVRFMFPQKNWIRLPMAENSRSLNLSNATAVIVYEAWRQQGFQPLS